MASSQLSDLPSVERVLSAPAAQVALGDYSRETVTEAVRQQLGRLRGRLIAGEELGHEELNPQAVVAVACQHMELARQPTLKTVINATGVVLHTNLGRAQLAQPAIDAVVAVAGGAAALEYDLGSGLRGDRDTLVEDHLLSLTGAEAATVVNNNAAAVLLALNSMAEGREVLVSRGELIEIGGSFRIPEVLAKSGAILSEVGTTNRTHPRDYSRAIDERTAAILKVHTSNYRIVGFTAAVSVGDLVEIARGHDGVSVIEDLGAGALIDLGKLGLPPEPVVRHSVESGADLVTFSGDKLLGGPQCGIIVGKREAVEKLRANPLKRALRCDKMTLAALEATLSLYRFHPDIGSVLPTLKALTRPLEQLEETGRRVVELLGRGLGPDYEVRVVASAAQVGSGAQPGVTLESRAVSVTSAGKSADAVARMFRAANPPVIGRIENDRFLMDLRTVTSAEDLVPEFV